MLLYFHDGIDNQEIKSHILFFFLIIYVRFIIKFPVWIKNLWHERSWRAINLDKEEGIYIYISCGIAAELAKILRKTK